MMIGKAEKAGSGADIIISGWKDSNWSSPNLEEKSRPDKVILTLPLISILDDKVIEELINVFGEEVLHLEHNKVLTLAFAITEGVVSNERLRYTLNLHKYDITKMLKDLCIDGYLISDGVGRGTTYHLNTGQNLTSSESNLTSSENSKRIKKKCTQKELFDIIIECVYDWKSLDEIARSINRNPQYLKGIIRKMVDENFLQREFPVPNHPAQRYKRG